jgi:hypothetical protein
MAALREDVMADEAPVNRHRRSPVSPFLLSPFKWAADSVASLADLDPAICVELCKIGRTRMHLVALVLAHLEVDPTPELGCLLLRGSFKQVITETLGRGPPAGLRRAVARMPAKVLAQESYRRLIALLDHRPTAKLLFHSEIIDDALIDLLFETPPPIRRHVLQLAQTRGEHWSEYAGLSDGLHVLVSRRAADSFEDLVCALASANGAEQFVGRLRSVCDSLPLPEAMPSIQIGLARRLDCVSEIQALAARWQNCLRDYIPSLNGGRCAIYVWDNEATPAACLVRRHGRLGWFLDEVKGPKNAEIDARELEAIYHSFAEAEIPQASMIRTVEQLYDEERADPGFDRDI